MPQDRVNLPVSFAPRLYRRLKAAAVREERSMNWLVNQAVAEYLRQPQNEEERA